MRDTISRKIAEDTVSKLFFPGPTVADKQIGRLKWAVDFAQAPPGKLEDRIALTLFPEGSVPGPQVSLFTEEETEQVRIQILAMLKTWVKKTFYKIENVPSTLYIENDPTGPFIRFNPIEEDYSDVSYKVLLVALLLLREGHRVRLCNAPARYGKPGEKCGRLFAGRLNQNYCSHLCQSRAATNRARKKPKKRLHLGKGKK